MKKQAILIIICILTLLFSSCSVIEGIFKAGVGVGIFLTVLFIGFILFLLLRFRRKKE